MSLLSWFKEICTTRDMGDGAVGVTAGAVVGGGFQHTAAGLGLGAAMSSDGTRDDRTLVGTLAARIDGANHLVLKHSPEDRDDTMVQEFISGEEHDLIVAALREYGRGN